MPRRFFSAAAAPWKGLSFLAKTPATWPFAMVAVVIATVLISLLAGLALHQVPDLVGSSLPPGTTWYAKAGRWLAQALATLTAVGLAIIVGAALAQPLSGPALERLVRLRERSLGLPERPPTAFWVDLWRSARSALLGLLALPILGLLSLLGLAIPGSGIVLIPVKILVVGVFVSWDLLDYPLSVRGWGIRERLRWLGQHKLEVLGFGVSLALVFLIPCMQLLLLPAGVVGATALVHQLEAADPPPQG